ncbi:MAG: hypothetical protein WDN72_10165 [Alphaproteobacteria bacterium]
MALRTDLPRVTPDDKPGLFNWRTGIGALWGSYIAAEFPTQRLSRNRLNIAFGALMGASIGYMWGEDRRKVEQQEGRVVRDPQIPQ